MIEKSSMKNMNIEVPCVNTNDIKKVLKRMSRVKGDADGLSIDLIMDAGNFLLVPSTWKTL